MACSDCGGSHGLIWVWFAQFAQPSRHRSVGQTNALELMQVPQCLSDMRVGACAATCRSCIELLRSPQLVLR